MKIASILTVLVLTACSTSPPELKYADGSNRIPIKPRPIPHRPSAAEKLAAPEAIAAVQTTAPEKSGANQAGSTAKPAISADKPSSPASPAVAETPAETFHVAPSPFAPKLKAKHKCSRPNNVAPGSDPDAALGHLQFKSPS